jgi:hypothetical protein
MGYYSVFILKRVRNTGHSDAYQPESAYFGESENMAKVSFYDAVRRAQTMSDAVYVAVWHDTDELIRVRIELH